MRPEHIWSVVFVGIALLVVIINDWQKRRLVAKADQEKKPVPRHWLNNKTSWGMVVCLIVGFVAFAYLRSHPEWTNRLWSPQSDCERVVSRL